MAGGVPDFDIVEDIKRVASKLARRELSRSEYIQDGRFSEYQIYDGGRTWEELCTAAGVQTKKKEPVSDNVYFERLRRAVKSLGRYPKTSERKKFGLNFSKRRYPTLVAFIERALQLGVIEPQAEPIPKASVAEAPSPVPLPDEATQKRPLVRSQQTQSRPVPPIPAQTKRVKWERIGMEGFPYAPQDEAGVVALFAILCSQRRIEWQILDVNSGKGIDTTCYDDAAGREIRVELKHTLSRGSWNHPIEDIDYVVCWENRWRDFPKPVIELRELLG